MKFRFEGYKGPYGSDIVEIDFNFMEFSELIKSLEPDCEPIPIPEIFLSVNIDLFKELLEKIEKKIELDDEDRLLFFSKRIMDLVDYFKINSELLEVIRNGIKGFEKTIYLLLYSIRGEKDEIISCNLIDIFENYEECKLCFLNTFIHETNDMLHYREKSWFVNHETKEIILKTEKTYPLRRIKGSIDTHWLQFCYDWDDFFGLKILEYKFRTTDYHIKNKKFGNLQISKDLQKLWMFRDESLKKPYILKDIKYIEYNFVIEHIEDIEK